MFIVFDEHYGSAFPISIDFEDHAAQAEKAETRQQMQRWRYELRLPDEFVGIGLDRIDYIKGIPERFRVFWTGCSPLSGLPGASGFCSNRRTEPISNSAVQSS